MTLFDRMISKPNLLTTNIEESKKERFGVIKETFELHWLKNAFFRNYCGKWNIDLTQLQKFEDLRKIPFFTTWELKRIFSSSQKWIELLTNKNVIKLYSSGTTQTPVAYRFDNETLRRASVAYAKTAKELFQFSPDDSLLMLIPSPEETNTGISRILHDCYKLAVNRIYNGVNANFELNMKKIKSVLHNIGNIHIMGTHFVWYDLLSKLKEENLYFSLPKSCKAILTGGWKGREKKMENEELYKFITQMLGIQRENIREQYGNIDVYTMFQECEFNQLHVFPWSYISVRDKNLEEVEEGEEGVMVILTSIVTSYPAFVLTSDWCKLVLGYNEKCECGRVGPIIEIKGRIRENDLKLDSEKFST
jgi:phenylacetate-coenzyme A ligase PaaK-like adenylate-forming protein